MAGHADFATFLIGEREPRRNYFLSERKLTLHLKRMICVGAAVFGLMATTAVASASAAISEAGSSLVFPLVYKWSHIYTGGSVSAAAGGSGLGITDISNNSVNIGASDAPMSSSQYSADSHNPIEIPWALSATDGRLQQYPERHPRRVSS